MELVKTILSLGFATAFRPWLELRGLVRVLGDSPSAELEGPPIVIDVPTKSQRAILRFRALILEQEGASSMDDRVASTIELVGKVNAASDFPSILEIRYDSVLIEPYTLPFHELVILMKDRYLRTSTLVDSATDVGLTFDQHEGDIVKHVQMGPMEKGQLNSMFLARPRDDLPEQFVFISLGYEQQRETAFDADYLRGFLEIAGSWQIDQSKLILDYLRKEGG